MKTFFILFIFLINTLFAKDVTPTTQSISAFVLPKDTVSIYASYNSLIDDLDIYNVNSNQNYDNYGYIGGLSGLDLSFKYGMSEHISIFYNLSAQKLDYSGDSLNNIKNEIFARVNFYDVPHYIFDAFSIDIGYIRNASNDTTINKPKSFKDTIEKLRTNLKEVDIQDNNIYYDSKLLSNQIDSKSGMRLNPSIKLSDLSDNSFFLRFIIGNRFSNALINLYTGFKYSDINTKISLYPKNAANEIYQELEADFGSDEDLSRDEKTINAGVNLILESENFIYDINYEYSKAFSKGYTSINDHNNVFDLTISAKATKNLLIFLGAKAMLNQYNTLIPYLSNRYTDESFHQKYAYIKLGFVYNFNLSNFIYKQPLK